MLYFLRFFFQFIIVAFVLFTKQLKSQTTTLHIAIGNNGYFREYFENSQKASSLLIINTLTWATQSSWKNNEKKNEKEWVLAHFPAGTYLVCVAYPQPKFNYWKTIKVDNVPESFLTLYPKDTTTTPIALLNSLQKKKDCLKISISSISCDEHLLDSIVLLKTPKGIVIRKDTYRVEHGPQAVGLVFICREAVKTSPTYLLTSAQLEQLNHAFNLSIVQFPGTERYYNYYDCKLGKRHYISAERMREGPMEQFFEPFFH